MADVGQTQPRCECGHPESAHPSHMVRGSDGWNFVSIMPCTATVYETVDNGPLTSGMNSWPCSCKRFKAVTS